MLKAVVFATLVAVPIALQSSPAVAQDMSRHPVCAGFGKAAAHWERRAMGQGCRLAFPGQLTFRGNEGGAYSWCMRTSDGSFRGRSPQALGHKSSLERLCSAQLRKPVRL